MTSKTTNKFSREVRTRAVRMVLDHEAEHTSRWQAILSIAAKIGCARQALNEWLNQAERDSGRKPGLTIDMATQLRALERENRELRQPNEILREVWRQLLREGHAVARCTVARLMRSMGLQGVIPGKPVRTTISDKAAPCPQDHVNRQFKAPRPNALWGSDFNYVPTWTGFVYVAFVINAYARRIVGWRASRTAHAGFVFDALEQALHDRRPMHRGGLEHHSDPRSQYVSIKHIERLREAGVELSVGSVGDSYDNGARRDYKWPLQGPGHPPVWAMAVVRGRRVRLVGMGRLVQQP